MSKPAMTPQQVIDACRARLTAARSIETVRFEELYSVGTLGTLQDLGLISQDAWRDLRAEFDALADERRGRAGTTRRIEPLRVEDLYSVDELRMLQEAGLLTPEQSKVSTKLTVRVDLREFDVSAVPGVMVGDLLSFYPHQLPAEWKLVQRDEYGFRTDAPIFGRNYVRAGGGSQPEAGLPAQQASLPPLAGADHQDSAHPHVSEVAPAAAAHQVRPGDAACQPAAETPCQCPQSGHQLIKVPVFHRTALPVGVVARAILPVETLLAKGGRYG